jgi:two-component system response regulator PilR (NtrC family)
MLSEHILQRLCQQWNMPLPELTSNAWRALKGYSFPGNVRELENVLERALTLSDGNKIDTTHLQLPDSEPSFAAASDQQCNTSMPARPAGVPLEDYLQEIERSELLRALDATHWNRTAAAKRLGMTFRSLRYRLQKLSLDQSNDDEEQEESE